MRSDSIESPDAHGRPLPGSFRVAATRVDGAVVVRVSGELDELVSGRFRSVIAEAVESADGRPVVIDLERCTFCDSSGLGEIIHAARESADRKLILAGGTTLRVLDLIEIDRVLPVHPSVASALASLGVDPALVEEFATSKPTRGIGDTGT